METKQTDFESLNLAEVNSIHDDASRYMLVLELGQFELLLWCVKNVTSVTVVVVVVVETGVG